MINRELGLLINSVFLVITTVVLAYQVICSTCIREIIEQGKERLDYEKKKALLNLTARKYTTSITVKLSFIEKVELTLIRKSNIKRYLPFANFYLLLATCFLIFIVAFDPVYRVLYFIPSTIIICMLLAGLPVLVLDLMGKYNSDKIRKKLAEFIAVINRWCSVREDIFYAFEKAVESGITDPLKNYIYEMVIQVKSGVDPLEALDILQLKVGNSQFKDFIYNIKQNVKYRGDIRSLLASLEEQFYKIEEEFNRRKISTFTDRVAVYSIMVGVLGLGYYFIKSNARVEAFYLGTIEGKGLLTLFCMLYFAGILLTFKITDFEY